MNSRICRQERERGRKIRDRVRIDKRERVGGLYGGMREGEREIQRLSDKDDDLRRPKKAHLESVDRLNRCR